MLSGVLKRKLSMYAEEHRSQSNINVHFNKMYISISFKALKQLNDTANIKILYCTMHFFMSLGSIPGSAPISNGITWEGPSGKNLFFWTRDLPTGIRQCIAAVNRWGSVKVSRDVYNLGEKENYAAEIHANTNESKQFVFNTAHQS